VMEVLPKRFEKYGLTVHPDKTQLIDFRSPPAVNGPEPLRSWCTRSVTNAGGKISCLG
jgi:hypothetical protein